MPVAAIRKAETSGVRTPWRPTMCPAAWAPIPAARASGMKARPVIERAGAEHVLKVERAEEEETEDRAGRDEHQEETAADGAVGEPLDPQERLVCAALPGREGAESNERRALRARSFGSSPSRPGLPG